LQSAVNEQSEALQNLLEGAEGQGMDPLLRKQIEQYLDLTRNHAATISGLLSEIMMAQSFQDLTGQVIAKMLALIDELENGLIMVLLENIPEQKREDLSGYFNGPQVNPKANAEAVTNQDQVDDLLSSLGL